MIKNALEMISFMIWNKYEHVWTCTNTSKNLYELEQDRTQLYQINKHVRT